MRRGAFRNVKSSWSLMKVMIDDMRVFHILMVSRTVGRGPVPRHRSRTPTIAGDRPPRYEKKTVRHRRAWALACHTRMRAGSPRHRPCARPCRSGSPDPDPFVIRRAQTTERGTKKNDARALRSFRSLMSIAAETRKALRSFRSLIVFDMPRVFLLRT